MAYFENDQSIHEKGEINVCEIFAVTQPKVLNQDQSNQDYKSQFSLVTANRIWQFKCENAVELTKWLKYLRKWAMPEVIQSGYLFKKHQQKWVKYYFELNVLRQLRYYEYENKNKFISVIHIPNIKQVKLVKKQIYG